MNILLSCSSGITTAMLAEDIQKDARSQGKDYTVWAVDEIEILNEVSTKKIDLILIGPQIKFKLNAIRKRIAEYPVPVELLNQVDFAMGNTSNIIKFIEKKVGEKNE